MGTNKIHTQCGPPTNPEPGQTKSKRARDDQTGPQHLPLHDKTSATSPHKSTIQVNKLKKSPGVKW